LQFSYNAIAGQNLPPTILRGLNINTTTANIDITISVKRSLSNDLKFYTLIAVTNYISAYDPNTGCCVSNCPAESGLDVNLPVPVCVSCNTKIGLYYNPVNQTCTCLSGYYQDFLFSQQCYLCSALYCSICNPLSPSQCYTCAPGAILDPIAQSCTCGTGYYINGTRC